MKIVFKIALAQIEKLLAKIFKNNILALMKLLWVPFSEAALAYLDKDKDNEAQLKAILVKHAPKTIDGLANIYKDNIFEAINDAELRELVEFSLQPTAQILKALVDADPNNKAQIKSILEDYKAQGIDFAFNYLIKLAELKIKDQFAREFLIDSLKAIQEEGL